MAQNIVEKIAEHHLADGPPKRPVRAGDFVSIWPRHILTHDNSAAVIKKFNGLGVEKVRASRQPVIVLDHDIQNSSPENLEKYRAIGIFAREQQLDFYPAGSGIGHQIMVENGYVLPGSFVVASDSHANMYGALGAVGTPVVRTDAACVWATGEFWWQIPRTFQVVLEGKLPEGTSGKDVIIALCGLYNQGEVLNAALEFTGPGVATLGMDDRFTIANMTTEWGGLVGWFPVDEVTLDYLETRRRYLNQRGVFHRLPEGEFAAMRGESPRPDPDAVYAGRIVLDLAQVSPHVSGPDKVQVMSSLAQMQKRRVKIDKAYIVSCVNSRDADLEQAAAVLAGKKVSAGVELYVAAASQQVQQEAENRGHWRAILDAGAKPLPPGCGPCIGLGVGLLEPGEVGISATNRNFKGRMGSRDAQCYLASPRVVAASAVAGYITGPEPVVDPGLTRQIEFMNGGTTGAAESVEIIEEFPETIRGRLVFVTADNLNTDGIYGKDFTYREDMDRDAMARVVMSNYAPEFASAARPGDVLVGGSNFGTGSSREQAVTALQAKGISALIAASFSQTYLRNAFNNGFICIESAALVRRLREDLIHEDPAPRFLIPGSEVEIDFRLGLIRWQGDEYRFPPLSRVPQSLVVSGGIEHLIGRRAEPV